MSRWAPLRLAPILKPRVWGGTRLRDDWGKAVPTDEPYGESWEATWRPDDTNTVVGGRFDGRTLEQIAGKDRAGLVGTALANLSAFPLLAKILDCEQRLSVQVHPTPSYAAEHGDAEVKMEAWYVLDASDDAQIIFGLQPGVTRADFASAVSSGTLSETLQQRSVSAGDVVLVTPGTVHALLEGLLVYEIQQSSDTTYRVFDWDRMGIDGTPRELHVTQALDCIAFGVDQTTAALQPLSLGPDTELLVATQAFALERVTVSGTAVRDLDGTRCELVTVIEGVGEIEGLGGVSKGDTIFVPAAIESYATSGAMVLLVAYYPDMETDVWARARAAGHGADAIRRVVAE